MTIPAGLGRRDVPPKRESRSGVTQVGQRQPGKHSGPGGGPVPRPNQAEKLDPHPQELVALGFPKTNPRPMISSLKSIVVPFR